LLPALSLLPGGAPPADAQTRTFRDERRKVPHDIREVVVDNTGPQLRVSVWHKAKRWRGQVVLKLDTAGNGRPEYKVSVRHGYKRPKARFQHRNGSRWRCGGNRWVASKATRRLTRMVVPRRCISGGATKLGVKAIVWPERGRADRKRTPGVPATVPTPPAPQPPPPTPPKQTAPNVLMFVVDDMRWDDLRVMPRTRAWLQQGGTQFTNSFSPYPLCCPARSSIFTGKYTHNHEVYSHTPPWGFHAFDDRSTIATWLKSAGYQTMLLGKYLNGYGSQPPRGATTGDSLHYVPPGWTDWRAAFEPPSGPAGQGRGGLHRYYGTELTLNGTRFQSLAGQYQTDAYGAIMDQYVDQQKWTTQPYFSYVSFTAPHAGNPRQAIDPPKAVVGGDGQTREFVTPASPQRHWSKFRDQAPSGTTWTDRDTSDRPADLPYTPLNAAEKSAITQVNAKRLQALFTVDEAIDRTMRSLRDAGELGNTYVIFTSDNGYYLGEQGIRQGKLLPYEAALRVPLLMRGPGIPAGATRTDPFSTVDLAPTIMQMAGRTPPASVDGQGMLPVAKGGDRGWTRPILVNTGPGSVVRESDESGTELGHLTDPGAVDNRYILGIRTKRWVYLNRAGGFEELFDLTTDPRQTNNLLDNGSAPASADLTQQQATLDAQARARARTATAPADDPQVVLEQMRAELAKLKDCAGASCRPTLPPELQ